MNRSYCDICDAVRDAQQWQCLWIWQGTVPIPVWWTVQQVGRISAVTLGLMSLVGPVGPLSVVSVCPSDVPDNYDSVLRLWLYRYEAYICRPDALADFNLRRDVPRKYRTYLRPIKNNQPSLFT